MLVRMLTVVVLLLVCLLVSGQRPAPGVRERVRRGSLHADRGGSVRVLLLIWVARGRLSSLVGARCRRGGNGRIGLMGRARGSNGRRVLGSEVMLPVGELLTGHMHPEAAATSAATQKVSISQCSILSISPEGETYSCPGTAE